MVAFLLGLSAFVVAGAITGSVVGYLLRSGVRQDFKRRRGCAHPHLLQDKWLDEHNTPMAASYCPDCGFYDRGHVHADPTTWVRK